MQLHKGYLKLLTENEDPLHSDNQLSSSITMVKSYNTFYDMQQSLSTQLWQILQKQCMLGTFDCINTLFLSWWLTSTMLRCQNCGFIDQYGIVWNIIAILKYYCLPIWDEVNCYATMWSSRFTASHSNWLWSKYNWSVSKQFLIIHLWQNLALLQPWGQVQNVKPNQMKLYNFTTFRCTTQSSASVMALVKPDWALHSGESVFAMNNVMAISSTCSRTWDTTWGLIAILQLLLLSIF